MNDKQIADIDARANAATPGPWEVDLDPRISGADQVVQSETELTICFMAVDESLESDSADTFFIAHAREDIPALINEVGRQAAEIERLTRALDKILITSGRQTIYKIARAAREVSNE